MSNDHENSQDNPELASYVDPAWEARVIALIHGEASEFEREDIERQFEEKPELRALHRRLAAVDDLVAEAHAQKPDPEWRLAPGRRAALLKAISGGELGPASKPVEAPMVAPVRKRRPRRPRRVWAWLGAVGSAAAVLMLSVAMLQRLAPEFDMENAEGLVKMGTAEVGESLYLDDAETKADETRSTRSFGVNRPSRSAGPIGGGAGGAGGVITDLADIALPAIVEDFARGQLDDNLSLGSLAGGLDEQKTTPLFATGTWHKGDSAGELKESAPESEMFLAEHSLASTNAQDGNPQSKGESTEYYAAIRTPNDVRFDGASRFSIVDPSQANGDRDGRARGTLHRFFSKSAADSTAPEPSGYAGRRGVDPGARREEDGETANGGIADGIVMATGGVRLTNGVRPATREALVTATAGTDAPKVPTENPTLGLGMVDAKSSEETVAEYPEPEATPESESEERGGRVLDGKGIRGEGRSPAQDFVRGVAAGVDGPTPDAADDVAGALPAPATPAPSPTANFADVTFSRDANGQQAAPAAADPFGGQPQSRTSAANRPKAAHGARVVDERVDRLSVAPVIEDLGPAPVVISGVYLIENDESAAANVETAQWKQHWSMARKKDVEFGWDSGGETDAIPVPAAKPADLDSDGLLAFESVESGVEKAIEAGGKLSLAYSKSNDEEWNWQWDETNFERSDDAGRRYRLAGEQSDEHLHREVDAMWGRIAPDKSLALQSVRKGRAEQQLAESKPKSESESLVTELRKEAGKELGLPAAKVAATLKAKGKQLDLLKSVLKDGEPAQQQAPQPPAEPAPEVETLKQAFSTFSLHVADVSFKLAMAALLEKGEWPEPAKIRTEEFVNAFDYGDPSPSLEERVACRTEQSAHPFLQERNLVRVAMRTAATGRGGSQPLRLTVLLDKSGSMERADRERSVLRAMQALATHLDERDLVTVLSFARQPRLLVDRLPGNRAGELVGLVARAPSEGGTNMEEALRAAAEIAGRQFLEGGMNRIVLLTDGAANLGNARPEKLREQVVALRRRGVAFDACGVGADGLNDAVLEALTRDGDGRYYFLNRPEDADAGFVRQLAGALRPAARNVKVQVVFNPRRVPRYRLLGFEKHRLKKEDFRNDKVDAAEMAAAEAGVALYQVQVDAAGEGEIGEVFVRFQDMATGRMVEHSWAIPYEERPASFDQAAPSMQLAGTAAFLAEKLRGGPAGDLVRLDELSSVAAGLKSQRPDDARVRKLAAMVEKARGLSGTE